MTERLSFSNSAQTAWDSTSLTTFLEWQPIPSAPDYFASAGGQIRGPRGLMSLFPRERGYLVAQVAGKQRRVNILVCEAFHGPRPSPLHHAAHLNHIRTDNSANNLAWKLPVKNSEDIPPTRRRNHAKLRVSQVQEILARRAQGEAIRSIHKDFSHVCYATLSHICNGRNWNKAPLV